MKEKLLNGRIIITLQVREIKLLYKGLVERLMPVKEPLEDEKEAIESSDETVSEKEIMEVLS